MRKFKRSLLCLAVAAASVMLASAASAEVKRVVPEGWKSYVDPAKSAIRLTNNMWGHTPVWNWIFRIVFEEGFGYPTEEVVANNVACMIALTTDEADVHSMIWDKSLEGYPQRRDAGELKQIGKLVGGAVQGVVVPRYVVEGDKARGIEPVAPDLRTVKDLLKYAHIFKDPEDPRKGGIYNADPSYLAHTVLTEKYHAYGLDKVYNLIECSAPAKVASLKAAYERGEPWVGYGSMPNIEFNVCDCILLDDEPYDPKLFTPEAHYTCAWAQDDIVIAVSNSLAERAPEACEFLSKWTLGTQEIYNNVGAIVKDIYNEDDGLRAALFYMTKYSDGWRSVLSRDAADRVQAYLDAVVPLVQNPSVAEVVEQAKSVGGFTGAN